MITAVPPPSTSAMTIYVPSPVSLAAAIAHRRRRGIFLPWKAAAGGGARRLGSAATAVPGHDSGGGVRQAPVPEPNKQVPVERGEAGGVRGRARRADPRGGGGPPKKPYCSLISGLADLEAAVCVCLAINANVLGINLDIAVDLILLVNYCGRSVPAGFTCA
ncbi:hypothetical protein BAE44_0007991 [Dichanthelium oligosanthes]|uniref:Hydrophobic seed protein domain-containing protein n=1 Tax=Dichanthelium oligosanthes TaxID=888268 RepID=A0A1E5W0X3_9POAL|nr:hypothetical protein BAE44_0007991 [Dichanthelium oligosanthes]